MANDLNALMPRILAQALTVLRETAIMPRLVNTSYGTDAKKKGSTVDVPITSAMEATDVQPGPYSNNTQDLEPKFVQIPLNYWKEAAFAMTDKDYFEIETGIRNTQVEEAAKAIANAVDISLLMEYRKVANFCGIPGTTPFAPNEGTVRAQEARKLLNRVGTPARDRFAVLDVDAEANAVGLPAFQKANESGSDVTIREGQIGRKLGFDWYYDQLNPTHQAGSITPKRNAPLTNGTAARSEQQIVVDGLTSGGVVVGDVFSIAGIDQTFVITQPANVVNGSITLSFAPALPQATLDNAAVEFEASHVINLFAHRDAFALAVRPLAQENFENELGGRVMAMTDPVSGIPLRLEVRREHKRVRWSLDCLWGVGTPRPECAVRLAG